MSRARLAVLALFAAATLAACGAPTAPAPRTTEAPSLNLESGSDTSSTSRSGFQVGNG